MNTILSDNLDKQIINLGNPQNYKDYKLCNEKLTIECYGLAHKELFHNGICKKCFNLKQLRTKRGQSGKCTLIMDNEFDKENAYYLITLLTPSQRLKLSGLLTANQQIKLKEKLGLNNNTATTSNEQSPETSLNSLPKRNSHSYSSDDNLNNDLNNNLNNNSNNNSNNSSNNNSSNNSPVLPTSKKPILKIIST
jgi:hypothetical protein